MKIAFVYHLLIIVAEICKNEISCEKRIIGGLDAKPGQFPYIVSLRRTYSDLHFCGASIISPRVLLTAAHCLCFQYKYSDLYAVTGSIFTYDKNEGTRYTLKKSVCHEKWKYDEEINQSTNDIALALVNETIIYTDYVQPITLSNINVPDGARILLIGYGCSSLDLEELPPHNRLQLLMLEIIPNSVCRKYYDYIDNRDMCTNRNYSKSDRGGCYGDSGSPVVYDKKQVGVLFNMDESVPRSGPDLILRINMYLPWIRKSTRKILCNLT